MLLYDPSENRKNASITAKFCNFVNLGDPSFLYDWSIKNSKKFWGKCWDFTQIKGSLNSSEVLKEHNGMFGAEFFPNATLNFAENLLWQSDNRTAVISSLENGGLKRTSYGELRKLVSQAQTLFKNLGVTKGDIVSACLPNCLETLVAMLATSSLGGIFSSCSPDFGASGIIDRFSQLNPKILLMCDGYFWKNSPQDTLHKLPEITKAIPNLKNLFVVRFTSHSDHEYKIFQDELDKINETTLYFEQLPFNHPLYVMFSSGTTGKPKGIIHRAGGVLLEHKKELMLHTNVTPDDVLFYQTTCGWMMWNWLVSGLSCGATIVLYDGFPFFNGGNVLWDLADEAKISIFGTNAKYIALLEKEGIKPCQSHSLSSLHSILSTGSPLAPESFDYVYRDIKSDVLLSSISGGTDILGCFALGSPVLPVYRGELQTRSYGLAVNVFNAKGEPVINQKGELVCTEPFPSMPLGFVNDPENKRYKASYFERFPNVWHHGDFVELNDRGGMTFFGRSDATLNPGGVRIGTAEIYRQVETIPEVIESVAIGQDWDQDTRIVLFVVLREGVSLSKELIDKIQKQIRTGASPFHVPKKIISVPEIPRTRSGKIVELAIRDVVHGVAINNQEAISNPEALEHFKNIPELTVP